MDFESSYNVENSGLERRETVQNYKNFLAESHLDETDDNSKFANTETSSYDLGPPSSTIVSIAETTQITQYHPIRYVIKAGEYHVYELNVSSSINSSQTLINYYATGNLCNMPSWDSDGQAMRIQLATNITDLTTNSSSYNATSYYNYFERGFSNITFANMTVSSNANSTAYVVIMAPTIAEINIQNSDTSVNANDTWTYEIGMSTISPVHEYFLSPNFYLVDTDFEHALFISGNMTEPFRNGFADTNYSSDLFYTNSSSYYQIEIFASNSSTSTQALNLDWSYCALQTSNDKLLNTDNSLVSITTRGADDLPKIQYFFSGLNKSSSYVAYLTETVNHTEANEKSSEIYGGKAFSGVNFTTKSETNCQIIFNLDLCSDVAFAVPGNASAFSAIELGAAYDSYARGLYDSFNTSMQVIQCGDQVDDADRYSILRTCADCRESYRQWLCATTIPRCQDASVNRTYLYLREPNTSRTDFINEVIQPGPYNEVLPCIDLCHGIMQDCPSSFSFQCPMQNLPGFTGAYYSKEGTNEITCNYPGVVYTTSNSNKLRFQNIVLWACFSICYLFL